MPAPSTTTDGSRLQRFFEATARGQVQSDNNDGWLMAVELVTATFVWGGVGYLIDRFVTHTYPVLMSIGFVVGFFAGMYLLWLKTSQAPGAGADAEKAGSGDGVAG